jgi:hypothetical protein
MANVMQVNRIDSPCEGSGSILQCGMRKCAAGLTASDPPTCDIFPDDTVRVPLTHYLMCLRACTGACAHVVPPSLLLSRKTFGSKCSHSQQRGLACSHVAATAQMR